MSELVAERDKQLAKRSEIDQEIAKIDQALKALSALVGSGDVPVIRQAGGLRASGVKPAILAVLQEREGEWLHANDVLRAVEGRGIKLSAVDPKATIVTALIRMHKERVDAGDHVGIYRDTGNMWSWSRREPRRIDLPALGARLTEALGGAPASKVEQRSLAGTAS